MRTDIDFKKADTVTSYPGNHIYLILLQSALQQIHFLHISIFSRYLVAVYSDITFILYVLFYYPRLSASQWSILAQIIDIQAQILIQSTDRCALKKQHKFRLRWKSFG